MPTPHPPKLVPGVDYYMEGDKLVFTAEYHLKRGFCCNSGCRHCPYKGGADVGPAVRIVGLPPPPEPGKPG